MSDAAVDHLCHTLLAFPFACGAALLVTVLAAVMFGLIS